jgi:hypothetical protein
VVGALWKTVISTTYHIQQIPSFNPLWKDEFASFTAISIISQWKEMHPFSDVEQKPQLSASHQTQVIQRGIGQGKQFLFIFNLT